jgi:hypothetical protein
LGCPTGSAFAQPKSLIFLSARYYLDEYRVVFAVAELPVPEEEGTSSGKAPSFVAVAEVERFRLFGAGTRSELLVT